MKKIKLLPIVFMLALCVGVLSVGVFALTPTKNTFSGKITINSTNPQINLTAYYNSVDDDNIIGKTQPARAGVTIDITDSRLTFKMDNVNTVDDVEKKYVIIVIENTADFPQAAYFTTSESPNLADSIKPLTCDGKTSTGAVIDNVLKLSFSAYTIIPKNGTAQVKVEFSLLKLYTENLTTDLIDYDIFLNVTQETSSNYLPKFTSLAQNGAAVELGSTQSLTDSFVLEAVDGETVKSVAKNEYKIKVTDKFPEAIKISYTTPENSIIGIFEKNTYNKFYELMGNNIEAMLMVSATLKGAQTLPMLGIQEPLGFYALGMDAIEYTVNPGSLKVYNEIEIPMQQVFADGVNEIEI